MRTCPAAPLAALLLVAPAAVRADLPAAPGPAPAVASARLDSARQAIHFDPDLDIPVTAFALTAWVVTEVSKPTLAPAGCRWCDASVNGLDRAVRDALLWGQPQTANTLSNIAVFGLAPVSALGVSALAAWHDRKQSNIPADSVLILEAMALAMDVNQTVKYVAGRSRPFARFQNPAVLAAGPDPNDDDLSFFSGHTTAAFSLATASGTVATMRGYRWAPWVWTQGLALAVLSGYLRIGADRHYFTDVLTGAVFGAAVGVAIPLLHRPGLFGSARVAVGPIAGPGVGVAGVW